MGALLSIGSLVSQARCVSMEQSDSADHGERTSSRSFAAVGPCGIEISKLNYDQVGPDDGTREAVELRIATVPAGATFGDCGVTAIAPYEGSNCMREGASRAIEIGALAVPSEGVAVFARSGALLGVPALASASATSGGWLENGPDLVALEDQGVVVALVAIPGSSGPPSCVPSGYGGEVVVLPDDGESGSGPEHVLVACDGVFHRVEQSLAPWLAPNPCDTIEDAGVGPDAGLTPEGGDGEDASVTPDAASGEDGSDGAIDGSIDDATVSADATLDGSGEGGSRQDDAGGLPTDAGPDVRPIETLLTVTITTEQAYPVCAAPEERDASITPDTKANAGHVGSASRTTGDASGCSIGAMGSRGRSGSLWATPVPLLLWVAAWIAVRARRRTSPPDPSF